MSENIYRCEYCRTLIEGNSRYCVSCWRRRHVPCSACMVRWADGSWHPRRKPGRRGAPVDCPCCRNERWVLT